MKKKTILITAKYLSYILLFVTLHISCNQQEKNLTIEDYQRAMAYNGKSLSDVIGSNSEIIPNWMNDSSGFWYISRSPGKVQYLKLLHANNEIVELFNPYTLAVKLTHAGVNTNAVKMHLERMEIESDSIVKFLYKEKRYKYNVISNELEIIEEEEKTRHKENETLSPDGKWLAYAKDHNLYLRSSITNEIRQLSTKGIEGYEYGTYYKWNDVMVGEGSLNPTGLWIDWSDDSKWISTIRCDARFAERMYLLDWSQDSLYRPRLLSYFRGSPGDTNVIYKETVFFNIETGQELRPKIRRAEHFNPASVGFSEEKASAYLAFKSRGYQDQFIYSYDLNEGVLDLLYKESSETNIDNFNSYIKEKADLIFMLSERSGWRQIHSLNIVSGKEQQLTEGGYYIHNIVSFDEDAERVFFLASGREEGSNPYHHYLYSMNYDGTDLLLLTPEKANHNISLSPANKYFVDNISAADLPTSTVLREARSGEIQIVLNQVDSSHNVARFLPEIFTVIARDGETTLHGALWKPSNFNERKKYPIIDNSYTGPHTNVYPNTFRKAFSSRNQSLAELGFIVMQVDGLGSSGRSKEFHNYSYKNLGGSLEDHVGAIHQLASRYSWIDTNKVGIFGHSAGGYDAAHALLAYPDFYKVGVASSADHDHRMEKAWWPEMYMGWPVDSAYHLQSNITMAGNLKGKLLIVHGGIDENVNPSATFKLAEALIKEDKQFDMLILPSQRHGYQGEHYTYFEKTKFNYFVEHLLEQDPIWDY